MTEPSLLLALDPRMVTLGMVTALGGGILRDILINAVPPAAFRYWPYLAVAAGGALLAFFFSQTLRRFALPILFLDAAGLSVFCVTGATKSLQYGLGAVPAVILGAVTGVGGGTIRDVLVRRVPTVLTSGLYAIPALVGATIVVIAVRTGDYGVLAALGAALVCFLLRAAGIRYNLNAPVAPEAKNKSDPRRGVKPGCPDAAPPTAGKAASTTFRRQADGPRADRDRRLLARWFPAG
jgi:uncharacterized membrane protein YeiH